MHSWLHTPTVFRWIHKVHHTSKSPYVLSSFVAHPVEVYLSFANPCLDAWLVPQSLPAAFVTVPLLFSLQIHEHSGYEFAWLEREDFHWVHHATTVKNIGLFAVLDDAFGTTFRGSRRRAVKEEAGAGSKEE